VLVVRFERPVDVDVDGALETHDEHARLGVDLMARTIAEAEDEARVVALDLGLDSAGLDVGLRRNRVLSVVVACFALAAASPVWAQANVETGRVETQIERNYARLIFSFGDRPRHQVNAQPGVLVDGALETHDEHARLGVDLMARTIAEAEDEARVVALDLGLDSAGLVVACFALAAASPVWAQANVETGRVETQIERNYARLIFSFGDRPRHQVNAQPGVLVVRFERPVDVDVAMLRDALRAYTSVVRRDPDGRALRFALTPPHPRQHDRGGGPALCRHAAGAVARTIAEAEDEARVVALDLGLDSAGLDVGLRPDGRRRRNRVLSVVVACFALAAASPVWAQANVETGRVETQIERNYARLIFSFGDRPRHGSGSMST
jgi:acyl carrier protein